MKLRIELLVVMCVFAILVIVLRHLVVALFLIVSVLFGFACALGVTVVVFELLNPAGFAGPGLEAAHFPVRDPHGHRCRFTTFSC